MSIQTDSLSLDSKKIAEDCNVFKIYSLIASDRNIYDLKLKYEAGNFGYGHAKQMLFDFICEKYSKERDMFMYLMNNQHIIEEKLQKGSSRARVIARNVLDRVRRNIGY